MRHLQFCIAVQSQLGLVVEEAHMSFERSGFGRCIAIVVEIQFASHGLQLESRGEECEAKKKRSQVRSMLSRGKYYIVGADSEGSIPVERFLLYSELLASLQRFFRFIRPI